MGERVTVEELVEFALRNADRLDPGSCRTDGPRGNIIAVESRATWKSVVDELTREGYVLVTSSEYAQLHQLTRDEVDRLIRHEGELFALLHHAGPAVRCVVPLNEKEPLQAYEPLLQ